MSYLASGSAEMDQAAALRALRRRQVGFVAVFGPSFTAATLALSMSVAAITVAAAFDAALFALLALSLTRRLPIEAAAFSGPFPLTRASTLCLAVVAAAATAALPVIVFHW